MATDRPLPQEFPRDLALLRLGDVTPELPPAVAEAYTAIFEARRADPLNPRGVLLIGPGGLRPLMALMRLVVLRLRDLNFERFEVYGGEGRLLSAYVRGENLRAPLPDRAAALFIEGAHRVEPDLTFELSGLGIPLFATWEGPEEGAVWDLMTARSESIRF